MTTKRLILRFKSNIFFKRLFKIKDNVLNTYDDFLEYYKDKSDKLYLINPYFLKI